MPSVASSFASNVRSNFRSSPKRAPESADTSEALVAAAGRVVTSQGECPFSPNCTGGAGCSTAAVSTRVATSPRHSLITPLRSLAVSRALRSASMTISTAGWISCPIPQFSTMSSMRRAGSSRARTADSAVSTIVLIASPHCPIDSPAAFARSKCSVSRASSQRSRSRMPTSSNQALSSHEHVRAGVSGRFPPADNFRPAARNALKSSPSVCATCSNNSPAKPWTTARCAGPTSGATSTARTSDWTSSFTAAIMRYPPRPRSMPNTRKRAGRRRRWRR